MIILDTPQGTTDWYAQRLWRLTASNMKASITSTGKLSKSKTAITHIDKLIAGIELANIMSQNRAVIDKMDEWELKKFMADYNGDTFYKTIHTERGNELEADAVAAMSERIGEQLYDIGMCVMGDDESGVVSCSPDAHSKKAGKMNAGGEVKSQCYFKYLAHVEAGVLPEEHVMQVHASMAICEVDTWHFGSYFKGKPIFYVGVKRDDFTDTLAQSFIEFKEIYQERYEQVMSKLEQLNGREESII